ncbi:MAG: PIG-L family deacetylase [Ectothiorhodospiraceae bacterium]|nr:PIG-L family deacetylase [Ectothiorhodospiraceae bacterium]
MNTVLIIAPHPDDETLGCGGTLLRLAEQGTRLGWLIVTGMTEDYSDVQRQDRANSIAKVTTAYNFEKVYPLDLPTATLDTLPMNELIGAISSAINDFQPSELLLPHRGDVHSDHRVVFDACVACSKWFRYPFIKRIMSYETISETDFTLSGSDNSFHPSVFFDISKHLQRKLEIMAMYPSEYGEFPFPRSAKALTAQAHLRGSQAGYQAAEAFMLLRERND